MLPPAAATEPAALLLVDRCLDLLTPLSHGAHLLDGIYGCLPRRHSPGSLRCPSRHDALLLVTVISSVCCALLDSL